MSSILCGTPTLYFFPIRTILDQSIITWCLIFQFIFQHHTNVSTVTLSLYIHLGSNTTHSRDTRRSSPLINTIAKIRLWPPPQSCRLPLPGSRRHGHSSPSKAPKLSHAKLTKSHRWPSNSMPHPTNKENEQINLEE